MNSSETTNLAERLHLANDEIQRLCDLYRRSEAQKASLERELRKMQSYLDVAKVIFVVIGPDEKVALINNKGLEILECREEEIVGKNWFDHFILPEVRSHVRSVFARLMTGEIEPVEHYDNQVLSGNNTVKTISWHNTVLRDENGTICGTLSCGEDITARKLSELALKESEEKYRSLFEQSGDAVLLSTPEGRLVEINPAGVELFGYASREEMLAIETQDIYANPDQHHIFLNQIKTQGRVQSCEVTFRKKNGKSIIAHINAGVLQNDHGEIVGYQGIIRDMTEYTRLKEQFLHAQKMESIGRLAGGLAHDLNNFLTAIQGYIDLTITSPTIDAGCREDLTDARHACDNATGLIRQLLLFSRRQPTELKPVDLNEIVANLQQMLIRLIGEQFTLLPWRTKETWYVNADRSHIEQVVMNLVVNARDAMPQGGNITISLENVRLDESHVRSHPSSRLGSFVRLSVADEGIGMGPEVLSHLFEPFYTTKEMGKGTGLGLPVVYGIVEQHRGWIEVTSAPGIGSNFQVYFPAVFRVPKKEAAADVSSREMKGRGGRILLVEDENAVRKFAHKLLSANGYEVVPARNAREAMAIFGAEEGRFHLVFSDVVLPDQNGLELVSQLLDLRPGLKILLASGYSEDTSKIDNIHRRGYRYLSKPYTVAELLHVIRELLCCEHP